MNDMYAKLETLWNEMIKEAERSSKIDENIILNKERKLVFQEIFEEIYNKIKCQHMKDEVVFLDRHKVAAIIICSVIKTKIFECRIINENEVFLGNYCLALSAGLSYLQYELNQMLQEKGKLPIEKIIFPDVMYGKLSYKENLINMLYISDLEDSLNVLGLANIMFLLEQINLLQKQD